MKKISILTFTFSILLLIGVSCSMMDEPDMPLNDKEMNIKKNIHSTPIVETEFNDSILNVLRHRADSIFENDPFFLNNSICRLEKTKSIQEKNFSPVHITTSYTPDGNMILEIPVSTGSIWYIAEGGTIGIPIGNIHFKPNSDDPYKDKFNVKITAGYVQIEASISIKHTILGINYSTTNIGYIIFVDHPHAFVNERK